MGKKKGSKKKGSKKKSGKKSAKGERGPARTHTHSLYLDVVRQSGCEPLSSNRRAKLPGYSLPHSSKRALFVLGMLPGCSTADRPRAGPHKCDRVLPRV